MNNQEGKKFIDLCEKVQKEIYDNKVNKNFNITDIPLEFCLTSSELAEAFDAWLKKKEDLPEELADVIIYLLGLASILEINLGKEVIKKMRKNKKRRYHNVNGVMLKKH